VTHRHVNLSKFARFTPDASLSCFSVRVAFTLPARFDYHGIKSNIASTTTRFQLGSHDREIVRASVQARSHSGERNWWTYVGSRSTSNTRFCTSLESSKAVLRRIL
jgi:hypothetical protein